MTTDSDWPVDYKKKVWSLALSDRRFWQNPNTNKQYPTLIRMYFDDTSTDKWWVFVLIILVFSKLSDFLSRIKVKHFHL